MRTISDESQIFTLANETPSLDEQLSAKDFVIIAPDDPSGKAFESCFAKKNLHLPYQAVDIRTRVIGENRNTNPGVYFDLVDALREQYAKGHPRTIIACNTLQFWAEELKTFPELYENMPGIEIYTTFQAAKEAYPDRATRPMWLGTNATAKNLDKADFDTPFNSELLDLQRLSQEIIWRVKAIGNVDYSGAIDYDTSDFIDKEKLHERTIELVGQLKAHNINDFFLGCTELPIAFAGLSKDELKDLNPIDVGDIMAEKIKNMLTT